MPQMAPINWLILFILFSIIFLMFNIMNYFNYFLTYPTKTSTINNNSNKFLTWKW